MTTIQESLKICLSQPLIKNSPSFAIMSTILLYFQSALWGGIHMGEINRLLCILFSLVVPAATAGIVSPEVLNRRPLLFPRNKCIRGHSLFLPT